MKPDLTWAGVRHASVAALADSVVSAHFCDREPSDLLSSEAMAGLAIVRFGLDEPEDAITGQGPSMMERTGLTRADLAAAVARFRRKPKIEREGAA